MPSIRLIQRRQNILTFLREYSEVSISQVSKVFETSLITARRDLESLVFKELAWKIGPSLYSANKFLEIKNDEEGKNANEESIVSNALNLIAENSIIFLGKGRLLDLLTKRLIVEKSEITIITPSIHIASNFRNQDQHDVYLLGGVLDPVNQIIRGPFAEKMLRDFVMDCALIECKALDIQNGILFDSTEEISLLNILKDQCQNIVVLIESKNIQQNGSGVLFPFEYISGIITDGNADQAIIKKLSDKIITRNIAGRENNEND